jgi:hypothetical protein
MSQPPQSAAARMPLPRVHNLHFSRLKLVELLSSGRVCCIAPMKIAPFASVYAKLKDGKAASILLASITPLRIDPQLLANRTRNRRSLMALSYGH